ncbi:hypothetical protein [Pelovirga terrestris]|uniref:Flagellar hook-length control protein-like C-terminal domain-containing protein n=1 Tax=Pelovirga terrestris TaxID=2771352 RepID=A0A8J6UIM4_9BACT|nr:hypothetical protein [Pelovirga terrestris]MBD1401280.1 hypothetical protein [Pelovirga terrestris]
MVITSIPSPANLFLFPALPTVSTASGVAAGLRPEQLVRALVVATEARDEVLLEIGKERFRPVGARPLQPGQVLDLRIVQTAPRLEALVVTNRLQEQLAVRLPVLSQPFDWSGLLARLQHPATFQHLRPAEQTLIHQLRQLLGPAPGAVAPLQERVDQLVAQLRGLRQDGEFFGRPAALQSAAAPPGPVALPAPNSAALVATTEQSRLLVQLLGRLQAQLVPLVELGGERMSKDWQRATTEVFVQLRQYADIRSLPALRTPEWTQALQLLRHHPGVTEQIAEQATKLLEQLKQPTGTTLVAPTLVPSAPQTSTAQLVAPNSPMPLSLPPPQQDVYRALQPLLQELKTLLGVGSDAPRLTPALNAPLTPDLLGKIDGLTTQIHQLLTREGVAPLLQQGLQLVAIQLQQLTAAPPVPAQGEALGLLSQFFGLHLERELLLGKQKQALANLKQTLLTLQQKSGEDLREPLQRIELFQLCKARLSESQLQFLPLPLVGLSDGYLVAGRRETEEQEHSSQHQQKEVQISLSLRLSSLGSMRVDLTVLPDQGLVVRLACEDRHKMDYLKGCEEELTGALTQMKLRQIHYSADVRHPLNQLQQALLPHQTTLLDTRA